MSGANGPAPRPSRNEDEKRRIIQSLFSNRDQNGRLAEEYITHARISENQSINELLNPTSPAKERVAIVAVLADGAVRIHKARENDNHTFQIGRTWGMQELVSLENPSDQVAGIVAHFGKSYYWSLSSFGAKQRFAQSVSQIYEKFTSKQLNLIGFDRRQWTRPQSGSRAASSGSAQSQSPSIQSTGETAPLRPVDPLVPNRRSQPHTDLRQPPPMSPKRNSAGMARQALLSPGNAPYPSTPSLPRLSRERLSGSPGIRQVPPHLSPRAPIRSQENLAQPPQQSPGAQAVTAGPRAALQSQEDVAQPAKPQEETPQVPARARGAESPSIPPTSDLRSFNSVRRAPSQDSVKVASGQLAPSQMPRSNNNSASSLPFAPKPLKPNRSAEEFEASPNTSRSPSTASLPQSASNSALSAGHIPPMPPVPELMPRSPDQRRRTFGSIPGTPRSRSSGMIASPFYDTQRVWQTHSRHPSAASQQSTSEFDRRQAFLDLETTLNELQWDGTSSIEDLEKVINTKLQDLGEANTANVVSLDKRIDELEQLTSTSLDDSQMLQQLIGFFVVQLSGVGDEVSKIGGRGNEPQVVSMNQRNLYHELVHLLEMVSLPPEVIEVITKSNFASPHELAQLEQALVELHKAVQAVEFGGEQGVGSMRILQEQKGSTLTLASNFGSRVEAFLAEEFKRMAGVNTNNETPPRIDVPFLATTYPLAGLVLFMKESDPARYQSLLSQYIRVASQCYTESFSTYSVRWKRQAEQAVGVRVAFTLQEKQDGSMSGGENSAGSTAAAALAKRTKSLRQTHPKPPQASNEKNSFALASNNLATLERLFDQLVDVISLHVAAQQQLLVRFFHLSSHGGRRFDLFIRQVPVDLRTEAASQFGGEPEIGEVDTSREESARTRQQVSLVFSKMEDLLNTVGSFVGQSSILESVYLIAKIEIKLETLQSKDQEFLVDSLNKLHSRLTQRWTAVIDGQVRSILGSHVTKKRHGFLSIVSRFTHFVLVVEQALRDVGMDTDNLRVRKLVDSSHEQLYRAFLQIFQTSSTDTSADAAGQEDKEMLNHHVTMISNLNGIITQLETVGSFSIQNILLQAKKQYRTDLEAYINDVLHRPIGRIIEFVNLSKSPKFKNIKPKGQLAALKKAVVGFDAKEMRKSTETLRRRVEKHFYTPADGEGDSALFEKVWKAIGAQYLDYYNQISELARKLDGENAVEITRQDILSAF